jgi:hypothetical protein
LGESAKVNAKPDQGVGMMRFPGARGLRATKTQVFFPPAARNGQALGLFLASAGADAIRPA